MRCCDLGFGAWVLGFSRLEHVRDVPSPFYVVAIRKVRAKVAAAALLAARRSAARANHQPDGHDAPHPAELAGDSAADDEEISAHIHFGMLAGSTLAHEP